MKIRIRSKLGHVVEHEVERTGLNQFTKQCGCRIIISIRDNFVYLVGGWGGPPNDLLPHFYDQPHTLGALIEKRP